MKARHCLLLDICCLISGVILLLPAHLSLAEKWREGFNQEHPDTEIAVSGAG